MLYTALKYIVRFCHTFKCSYKNTETKIVSTMLFPELLAPNLPIFERLNIPKFDYLVIQRISLLMCKYFMVEVLSPIFFLFRTNGTHYEHNTRSTSCLHTSIGIKKPIYQTLINCGVHICL